LLEKLPSPAACALVLTLLENLVNLFGRAWLDTEALTCDSLDAGGSLNTCDIAAPYLMDHSIMCGIEQPEISWLIGQCCQSWPELSNDVGKLMLKNLCLNGNRGLNKQRTNIRR
jgi:hypothetical protein